MFKNEQFSTVCFRSFSRDKGKEGQPIVRQRQAVSVADDNVFVWPVKFHRACIQGEKVCKMDGPVLIVVQLLAKEIKRAESFYRQVPHFHTEPVVYADTCARIQQEKEALVFAHEGISGFLASARSRANS